ncbi:MAG: hypothetical protein R3C59_14860 [Planctomycetaceae bacterium]
MSSPELQLDSLNTQNLQVMQAYVVRASAARAASEEYDGWLERIDSLPEFTPDQLTQQHGQLIALGFLKFEITGRSVGLRYQISPRGKQALDRALAVARDDSDDNDDREDLELTDAA